MEEECGFHASCKLVCEMQLLDWLAISTMQVREGKGHNAAKLFCSLSFSKNDESSSFNSHQKKKTLCKRRTRTLSRRQRLLADSRRISRRESIVDVGLGFGHNFQIRPQLPCCYRFQAISVPKFQPQAENSLRVISTQRQDAGLLCVHRDRRQSPKPFLFGGFVC